MSILTPLPIIFIVLFAASTSCFIHVLALLFIWPISKSLYWSVHRSLLITMTSVFVFLSRDWGRIRVEFFCKPEDWKRMGEESSLVISNHRTDADGFCLFQYGQQVDILGGHRVYMKKEISFVPILGWLWWLSDYMFLSRSFAKDQGHMKMRFANYCSVPFDICLTIFVEGTRLTPAKLKLAQEFAKSRGIYVPQYTLIPRPKGFVTTVQALQGKIGAVYDVTFFVPEGASEPKVLSMLMRKPTQVQMHLRRIPVADLPTDDEALAQWLFRTYEEKDALLAAATKSNSFDAAIRVKARPTNENYYVLGWALSGLSFVLLVSYAFGAVIIAFLMSPAGLWFVAIYVLFLGLLVFGIWTVIKTSPPKKA